MQRLLFYLSITLPAVVLVAGVVGAWIHAFSTSSSVGALVLICGSTYLGLFMFQRSRDRGATFGAIYIRQDDDEDRKRFADVGALVAAVLLLMGALYLPFL